MLNSQVLNFKDIDESSNPANRRRELNHKKLKQSKQPYDALLMSRLLGEADAAPQTDDQEVCIHRQLMNDRNELATFM